MQGIKTKQQYEQIIITKFLTIGIRVYIPPPKEEDKAWYEKLYDAVVDFFNDIGKI